MLMGPIATVLRRQYSMKQRHLPPGRIRLLDGYIAL